MTRGVRGAKTHETVYVVRCLDFETAPSKTKEAAQRQLEAIEKLGACSLPHSIEEVRRRISEPSS